MVSALKSGKRWYRPRNVLVGAAVVVLAVGAWVVYETARVMRATPNPSVNYAAEFRALSEGYVRGEWDPRRAEQAWRLLNDAADLATEVLAEHDARVRADPNRYPQRFDFGDDFRIGFGYVVAGRELPADIDREREALAALRERGVFDLLDQFAQLAPGMQKPEVGILAAVMQNIPPMSHRDLARSLTAAMRIAAVEGDEAEVARRFDQALAIAQTASYQPSLVWHLVGASINRMAVDEVRHLMSEHEFDPATYRAALAILDRRELPPLELVLEGERLVLMEMVQAGYSDDGKGDGYVVNYSFLDPSTGQDESMGLWTAFLSRFVFPSRREFVNALDGYFDLAKDELARTPAQWIEDKRMDNYVEGLSARHFLLKLLAPALEKVMTNDRVVRMFHEATRATVAIELHKAERGSYPQSLDDLDSLRPSDPLHGGAFGYRLFQDDPNGRRYLLYSFGFDGTDDGGVERLIGRVGRPDSRARWDPLRSIKFGAGFDFIVNTPRAEWGLE